MHHIQHIFHRKGATLSSFFDWTARSMIYGTQRSQLWSVPFQGIDVEKLRENGFMRRGSHAGNLYTLYSMLCHGPLGSRDKSLGDSVLEAGGDTAYGHYMAPIRREDELTSVDIHVRTMKTYGPCACLFLDGLGVQWAIEYSYPIEARTWKKAGQDVVKAHCAIHTKLLFYAHKNLSKFAESSCSCRL